jgi:aryl-alcohol dehydrogenase-like predicted oxidoreductase
MRYVTHRDLTISTVGFGSYALSGAYGPADRQDFVRLVDHALELGVTFFDTAEAYGDGERVLGEALGSRRSSAVIATKVGIRTGLEPRLSRQYVLEACDRSLRALATDCVDLYQVHFDDPDTAVAETVGALEELRDAGKIRHYGVGHMSPERILEYCREGRPWSVLAELSAAEPAARHRLVPICAQEDMGVVAFSVTGRGVLTGRFGTGASFPSTDIRSIDPLFHRERFRSALRVAERIEAIAEIACVRPAQVAIAWVLAQPHVICALTGPSTVAHLEENVAAAELTIPSELIEELDSFLTEEAARLQSEQRQSVHEILGTLLPSDTAEAVADLVYAFETAIRTELVKESAALPAFRKLLGLRAKSAKPGADPSQLVAVQQELKELMRSVNARESK